MSSGTESKRQVGRGICVAINDGFRDILVEPPGGGNGLEAGGLFLLGMFRGCPCSFSFPFFWTTKSGKKRMGDMMYLCLCIRKC